MNNFDRTKDCSQSLICRFLRNKNPKQPFEISSALVPEITLEAFPSMRMGNESDERLTRSNGNWVKYYKEGINYQSP